MQRMTDHGKFEPAPPDPGIIPGGIRDRALQVMGYPVPPWWYRKAEKVEPDEAAGRARSGGFLSKIWATKWTGPGAAARQGDSSTIMRRSEIAPRSDHTEPVI
jgi:hypothetical protein